MAGGGKPEVRLKVIYDDGQVKVGVSKTKSDLGGLGSAGKKAGQEMASGLDQVSERLDNIQSGIATVGKFAATYLGFQGIKAGIANLVEAQMALQQIRYGLQAATGSAEAGAREFDFLSATVERVGVRLVESGQAYAGYLAAAKSANLTTAESRDLFTSVAEAGAVFNLSAGQMQSSMVALVQMMGMGEMRSQELRMQLGSALPGAFSAFKRAYEDAFGKGTFEKALAEGLDVKEFAPMLGEAIRSLYSEKDLEDAANDLNSQLAKMENAIVRFKASFTAGDFSSALTTVLGSVSGLVNGLASLNSSIGPQVLLYGTVTAAMMAFVKGANIVTSAVAKQGQAFSDAAGFTKVARAAHVLNAEALLTEAKASQVSAAAAAEDATAEVARAKTKQTSAAMTVTLLEADLAATRAKGASAVASGELALAEQAVAAAKAKQAQTTTAVATAEARAIVTKNALTAANGRVATSTVAVDVATKRLGGSMSLAAVATRGLATAGRGLLAVLGGWPGVILAAAAALVYFATRASEAKKAADSFIESLNNSQTAMQEYSKQMGELADLRNQLRDAEAKGNQGEIDRINDLIRARQGELAANREAAEGSSRNAQVMQASARERLKEAEAERDRVAKLNAERLGQGMGQRGESADLGYLREYERAQEKVNQAERALREADTKVQDAQKALDASRSEVAQVQAREALEAAESAAGEAKSASAKAIQELQRKQQEALNPRAVIENQVNDAVEAAKKQDFFGRLTEDQQAAYVTQVTDATRAKAQAEFDYEQAKKKSNGTDAEAAKLAREQKQDDKARARANEEVAASLESLADSQRDATDALREDDPIRDRMEQSLRNIDREVSEAEKTIADSKLTDDEKAKALQSIAEAADNARVAVRDLATVEKQRQMNTAVRESAATADEDAFRSSQDMLARDRRPGARDQYNRNEIDRYYGQRVAEERGRFEFAPDSPEALAAIQRVEDAWALAVQNMMTETEALQLQMEESLAGSFTNTIMAMLTQGMTLKEGLSQIFMSIFSVFMENMVVRPLAELAARFIRENLLVKAAAMTQTATQVAASATVAGAKQSESAAVVSANASEAASGAAASQASIPYVGPVLAIAAMIAMFAAVMAMQKKSQKNASYAEGGEIHGPGTGTSDDVPIWASNGEYMIKASAVSKYGTGFLDAVNSGQFGMADPMAGIHQPKTHFADGGLIGGDTGGSPGMPKAGDRASAGVRVVNVIDPRLFQDYIDSPEGQETILNVIDRHPRRVKASIGG